jgi:hypothetical protein
MKMTCHYPLTELETMLNAAGHETWGWHIYRCTYSSDDDWSKFMKLLKTETRRTIEFYGATHYAPKQIWTVVEDQKRLDNATKSDVRGMFNKWVNSPEAAAEQPNTKGPPTESHMARYVYCMHVDEESLRSVLADSKDWHVNIINRNWVPEEEDDADAEESDEDGELPDEVREADVWPEIEGITEEDVGWVMASMGILVCGYIDLCNPNYWDILYYTRPPRRAQ